MQDETTQSTSTQEVKAKRTAKNSVFLDLFQEQNLSSKEVEVVTIMMSLFDDEQIMRTYAKDIEKETERKTAERMIRDRELSLEKIARYVPLLSMDDLKEIEAEIMQLA